MKRNFLKNRRGSLGILSILLAILLIGSEVAYFTIVSNGYSIDLDYLPDELKEVMKEKGFGYGITSYNETVLWKAEGRTRATDVKYVTGQLYEINLTFPENDCTRYPVYIYEYIVTARNKFNWSLFSLHVRGTFIDAKNFVHPPPHYYDTVIP